MKPPYVLVTPARNEEKTLPFTIASVVSQTHLPVEWVIVSDGSSDNTVDVARATAADYPFIRVLDLKPDRSRSFSSVVFALQEGIQALATGDWRFIGFVDADIRFKPDFIESLLRKFCADEQLGLAGGLVLDCCDGVPLRFQRQTLSEVAGATHFFRRECFHSIGTLIPIPEGGWDSITALQARSKGWRTRTYQELLVEHLKPRNSAEGGAIRRKWQMGTRDYAVGNHPVFQAAKCLSRITEPPFLLGAAARFSGYFASCFSSRKRLLPAELVEALRREQLSRISLLPLLDRRAQREAA